jgi:hypothetical protein
MKEVRLSKGKTALVDDEDYEKVARYSWYYFTVKNREYAQSKIRGRTYYMHRLVMLFKEGRALNQKEEVDHIDGNGLNNSRSNLRICNHLQNNANKKRYVDSGQQYLGVSFEKRYGKKPYKSRIMHKGANIYLGIYPTELEAAIARDLASVHFFGQFAKLNFPERLGEYLAKIKEGYDPLKAANSRGLGDGVHFDKGSNIWQAEITVNGQFHFLGRFKTEQEAKEARKQGESKYLGAK